ncbi:xanthine dehydrogenase family protein molybdopterin-binding subunit [Terriglobus roseus]|uniref:CO or xanthine dehydrogenase, Mo-binding subunit n=1 Tax=Terriglobus roseus TaxID=392734 RepID=A0A1H4JV73_9BACT|nr:molybdopterin cofactor-binding domain-containing protein [Terriglobus roseus]SEB49552.1 CO or xanthine dehydrogenase, Mo-binding subunit [Terriglobus roseus]
MEQLLEALTGEVYGAQPEALTSDVYGAKLTRRGFVKAGGALVVGFGLLRGGVARAGTGRADGNAFDPGLPQSWIEIHPDNTVLYRTGKSDFGQGTIYTAYKQIIADELDVSFEAITTVVTADTDTTPEGGGTFGLLGEGIPNIRKAAAYTREALLQLASQRLGVPKDQLKTADGIVSGGGKKVSYGDLVKDGNFQLTIPVGGDLTSIFGLRITGNPPLKPTSEMKVVGKSYNNSNIASKVKAEELWVTNVKLPGMMHGRVVHPGTLGSHLVSAGTLDKTKFPNTQLIVKGDLVAVVAPTEWEAVQASWQVAGATKWTEWKGLPGKDKLYDHLRNESDWKTAPVAKGRKNKGDTKSVMEASPKKLEATYRLPYWKHAPIGPTLAVADYKTDGSVVVHTHTQNAQALRGQLAKMLGTSINNVVVKTYSGAGHYGRSNGGNAGAEDEAVILSKEVGKPVRVQWMRNDEMQWSTQSPVAFADVRIAVDAGGKISAYEIDHFMPAMQDDRLIGAVIAGLPTMNAPSEKGAILNGIGNGPSDDWLYAAVPALTERAHGTYQIGQQKSPVSIGIRDHTMRTPGQFQQNFPREMAMSEAAGLAGADPLQFRLDHAKDERLIQVLNRLKVESGWEARPSPSAASASGIVRGHGVSAMLRSGTYWGCACEVSVNQATGAVKVDKYTIVLDPGIVVNPDQLKRQVQGGAMMGLSIALHEEVPFNESGITATDWYSYPILTMAEIPEFKVVLLHRPEFGTMGQGSEAANALGASAIASAVYDATGKPVRQIPLRPAYVKQMLAGNSDINAIPPRHDEPTKTGSSAPPATSAL